jgi:dCMP deaminase
MLLALVASQRSPDPSTQVGAYICNTLNRNVSTGYNGTPRGIDPETIPWARHAKSEWETKYPYIVHAERNAILNAEGPVQGAKLYVTIRPCHECAKEIIQAGIGEVICLGDPNPDVWLETAKFASELLIQAGIRVRMHQWDQQRMAKCFKSLQHALNLVT